MPLARAPDILFAPEDHHDHLGPPFLHCGAKLYRIEPPSDASNVS